MLKKILSFSVLILAACSSTKPSTQEIEAEALKDVGIDTVQVTASSFCEAFAAAPSRWLNDAYIPLKFWHDNFAEITDTPVDIRDSVDALTFYADQRIKWHLGESEAPEFSAKLQEDARSLAVAASKHCPELPLLLGLQGKEPTFWPDEDKARLTELCQEEKERVQSAIKLYSNLYSSVPSHIEELEAGLYSNEAGFLASETYGIRRNQRIAEPIPVAPGPCSIDTDL